MGKTLHFEDAYDQRELDRQYRELQSALDKVDSDYVTHVQRTVRFNEQNQRPQVSVLTQFYHMQLMYSCVAPFSEGINMDTITRAGGMFLGAYLCSKQFRSQVEEYGKQHDHRKAEEQLAKLNAWEAKHNCELSPDKKAKRDKLLMQINDGRMPLSPKSTALTHLGFAKRAYADMRKPGVDFNRVMKEYNTAVGSLYEQAQADGCDFDEISRNFRMSVATLGSKDPSVNAMFEETCYGGFSPKVTSEYETHMTDNGPVTTEYAVFNGVYQTPDGKPYTGLFHLREPMSVEEHVDAGVDMIARDLSLAGTDGAKFADFMIYNYSAENIATRRAAFADDFPNRSVREAYSEAQRQIEDGILDNLASTFDEQIPDRDGRMVYPWETAAFNDSFLARIYDADPELAERLYDTPDVAEAFTRYHDTQYASQETESETVSSNRFKEAKPKQSKDNKSKKISKKTKTEHDMFDDKSNDDEPDFL